MYIPQAFNSVVPGDAMVSGSVADMGAKVGGDELATSVPGKKM